MTKQTGKNVTTIQTPGATDDQQQGNDTDTGAGHGDAQGAAPATAAKVKVEAIKADTRVENRPSRAQYASMHSSEVDPSTLKSAVLCKDGWVCPPTVGPANPK